MRKNGSSVIWCFFQVTKVEKRASRKRFLKSRRSRDFGMFSRCPFFNRGNLEKTSNYTRTIFLQFARTIMTTDCFFAMFWFFRMKIRFFVLKSEEKKGWVITPLGKIFFTENCEEKFFFTENCEEKFFFTENCEKNFS